MYGEDVLYATRSMTRLPESYEAALEEQDIDVRSMPRFDIKRSAAKKGLVFEAHVGDQPDVKLGQYESRSAYRPGVTVEIRRSMLAIEAAA